MWLLLACGDEVCKCDPTTTGETGETGDDTGTTPVEDCDGLATWEDGLAPSAEIRVAPGEDIAAAARSATPGTAIVLEAGEHEPAYVEDLRGEEGAPIWLGGEGAVFRGGSEALHLVRPAWLVVHDIEVDGAADNGVNIDDGGDYADAEAAHHVIIRGVDIHDVGGSGNQDCLKLSGLNEYVVTRSSFARCGGGGSGSGVDHVGCHHGLIVRNWFSEMSGNAIQAKGGSEDVEIRGNLIEDGGERAFNLGGSTGFEYFRPPLVEGMNFEAKDLRVHSNVVVGGVAPVAYVGCVACEVVNNTLVDPTNWVVRILQETTTSGAYEFEPSRDGVFVNNVVYYSLADLSTHVNVGPDTAPETFTFATNLWYAHDAPDESAPRDVPVTETGSIAGEDPEFVSGQTIGETSPASGAGQVWDVVGDHVGTCWRDPPSIGAFEVTASP